MNKSYHLSCCKQGKDFLWIEYLKKGELVWFDAGYYIINDETDLPLHNSRIYYCPFCGRKLD